MREPRVLSYVSEVMIDRSSEEVFDFCSDLRNERLGNPGAKCVHELTDGPVGLGARFEARRWNTGSVTVEVLSLERRECWEESRG